MMPLLLLAIKTLGMFSQGLGSQRYLIIPIINNGYVQALLRELALAEHTHYYNKVKK